MTLLQHYQLSLFMTTAASVIFGLWVFIRRRNSKVAQLFCLYLLVLGFWGWCQAQVSFTNDPAVSLAWIRTMFYVVIVFPVLLTHFFSVFLGIDQRKVCLVGWVLVVGFLPFIASEQFLHQSGPLGFLPTMPRAGSFFLPFNLVWFAWAVYDFWLLGRDHKGSGVQPSRQQVNILLAAFIFGYITGGANYLYFYGICIPPLQPFVCYGVPIAILVIAYGVFAYGLFDIQVVIRKSLVYSILVTLLTVCYFGLVYAVERLLQVMFGYHSIWGSVTAFAVIALVFQPLKVGIQRLVDWLLFRAPQEELVKRMERLEQQVHHAEKLEAVSILAAGMAHEIKNPLTSIKTFAAYLPEKAHDPVFQQKFQRIVTQEVNKIDQIVRQLLDFAKPASPQLQPTQVSRALNETLDFLSNECLRRRIEVQRAYDADGTIQADPQQLRQVFLNLLLNSLEAMDGNGGTLSVSTAQQDSSLTVTIADTGVGIPQAHLTRLFDPFFSTKPHGTGLGLSIVHSIITEHHGTIAFDSQLDHGTRCIVTFPLGS